MCYIIMARRPCGRRRGTSFRAFCRGKGDPEPLSLGPGRLFGLHAKKKKRGTQNQVLCPSFSRSINIIPFSCEIWYANLFVVLRNLQLILKMVLLPYRFTQVKTSIFDAFVC